jgi:hypothetical protein
MHLPRITIISILLGIAMAMPHQQLRDHGFDLFPPMPLAQPAASSTSSSSSSSSSTVSSSPSATSTALTIPYGSGATHSADLVPTRIKDSSTDVSEYTSIHATNHDSNGRRRRRRQAKRRCPKQFILTRGWAVLFSIFAGFFVGIELTFWLAKLGPVSVLVSLIAGVVVAITASGIFYAIVKHTVLKKYGMTPAGKRAIMVRKLCAGAAARGLDCRRLSEADYQEALKTIRTQSPVKVGPGGCLQKAAKKAALV